MQCTSVRIIALARPSRKNSVREKRFTRIPIVRGNRTEITQEDRRAPILVLGWLHTSQVAAHEVTAFRNADNTFRPARLNCSH